jgi:hypothetical protein
MWSSSSVISLLLKATLLAKSVIVQGQPGEFGNTPELDSYAKELHALPVSVLLSVAQQ